METVPHYPVPTNPTDTLIVNADYATVIAEYDEPREKNGAHQSEAQLEKRLIEVLISQGYEYLPIHTEEDLLTNLRAQIEILNTRDNEPLALSDGEWKRLLTDHIAKPSEGRAEKTHRVQKEPRIAFERDNGTTRNITLLDRRNPNNNRLQVINQYSVQGSDGTHPLMNRYDVTILVNGLPMVHIELKKRGVSIKEAFQQIDRYQSQQLQQTRTLALKDALTLCQDPTFTQQTLKDFALMQFPSQEDFEHFLREKKADILLANQALSHRELASETPPLQPHKDNPTLSKEVALYLKAQKQPEIFSGKKLL